MDAYEKLREKLDLFPIGLPASEDTSRLLRLLFDEDEIGIAARVPNPPLMFTAGEIARKARVKTVVAAGKLHDMAARGLIMEIDALGQKRYALIPAVPGFLEMQFMREGEPNATRREAGLLWHKMKSGALAGENHGFATSGVRVVPIRKAVDASQRTHRYEEAESIVRDSGSLAIADCACRKSAMKCNGPLDMCMMFGVMADYLVEKKMAKRVSLSTALRTLDRAAAAGLVHTTTNSKSPVSIMCNCCACCCASLWGVTALNHPAASVGSNFRCEPVGDDCRKCGACVKLCPVDAITLEDEVLSIREEKCFGCGVCAHKCPTKSLRLARRESATPPASSLHLAAKMYSERGKLPRIIENIGKDLF